VAARLLGLRVRIPPGAWMFVLCVLSKDKGKMQDSQDKGRSTEYKRIKRKVPVGANIFSSPKSLDRH
jgi:hypothetical protein